MNTEQEDKAFIKVLEFISNTFYRTEENTEIKVTMTDSSAANYYDQNRIVLSKETMNMFQKLNLPRFVVFYHEIGHHLYSQGLFRFLTSWRSLRNIGPKEWHSKYHHLLNWLEDYFIEAKLKKEHPYLTDVLNCLKKLPFEYDIASIKYVFNYWYVYQKASPALSDQDKKIFTNYINRLWSIRSTEAVRFGYANIILLSKNKNLETHYLELIVEFYQWCESKGIFEKDKALPPLSNPNKHLVPIVSSGGNDIFEKIITAGRNGKTTSYEATGNKGTSNEHSHNAGKITIYEEVLPIQKATDLFKNELVVEQALVKQELLDMSQRLQADNYSLVGLFAARHKDSAIIQSRVIIPNFYNPHRLSDQLLFQEKQHTYMNVAIYRDISGSVTQIKHELMHNVCEKLHKEIPVDVHYYLYGSGEISIIEVPYIKWEKLSQIPKEYLSNPLYKQLKKGTNSDAIADVITQQFSEKWLNIIITDGDLHALMRRENIYSLLKNVFIISITHAVQKDLLGVRIDSPEDLEKINSVLSTINLDR
jgi:hypothetical protein